MIAWSPAGGAVSGDCMELKPHSEMMEVGMKPSSYGLALILALLLCLLIRSGGKNGLQLPLPQPSCLFHRWGGFHPLNCAPTQPLHLSSWSCEGLLAVWRKATPIVGSLIFQSVNICAPLSVSVDLTLITIVEYIANKHLHSRPL